MLRFLWPYFAFFIILLVGIAMTAPIPNLDNPDDFRYPENSEDINNMPMATVRPSVNPCI